MKIVIVGGGTAGWLTAFGLSHDRKNHSYTVIDSSKIGIIGVGESTTGAFSKFIKNRGISKLELIQETHALPKYGIKFLNWRNDGADFISPVDGSYSSNNFIDWALYTSVLNGSGLSKNSLGASLIDHNKTDYFVNSDSQLQEIVGGYPLHIDTYATGNFFKKKSINNGVRHIDSVVKDVVLNSETGFIEKVILENNTVIDGDLFIDCSGFSQVLIKKLNPEWDDYSNFLPVNTAIPFNVLADTREKKLYTTAKAMTSGWLWEIPTRNHINQGYIFCDRFINEEQAIAEIKKNYNSDIEYIKTIKFKAGKLKKSWIKNCVAIGLSSAFLEPLQATSIHCTVAQIEDFTNNCLGNSIETTLVNESIQAYNQRVSNLYASMADLISLHYSGGRQDTEFWKFMSDKKSKKVMEILKVASIRGTRFSDFELYYPYAGQGIWNHTIAGLGHFDREVLGNLFLEFNVDLYQSTNELKNLYRHNIKMFENCLSLKELDDYLRLINV